MDSPTQSKVFDPESNLGANIQGIPYSNARRQPTRAATMATFDDRDYEKGLDLSRARTRMGVNGDADENATQKAARKKKANILAIDALKQGTGQIKVDVNSVFMFLLRDGECYAILVIGIACADTMCRHLDYDPAATDKRIWQAYLRPVTSTRYATPLFRRCVSVAAEPDRLE